MKNIKRGKSTIVGEIAEGTKYTKAKDFIGEYAQGVLQIRGFLKNHSDMYNKDQYSLYIVRTGKVDKMDEPTMLMNIPTWYGETLAADFAESGLPAAEYFDGASIKSITETKTRYNTTTIEIEIYES